MPAHKSGQCKEVGCFREQWKDGYCRNCAQYHIQKLTIDRLNSVVSLLVNVSKDIKDLEKKLANKGSEIVKQSQLNTNIHHTTLENKQSSTTIPIKSKHIIMDEPTFIPNIEVKSESPSIRDSHVSKINKDVKSIIKKLGSPS